MYLIERISVKLGHNIADCINADKNKEEVITYGAFIMFQTLFSILLVLILGYTFNVFAEALIISFSGSILRKYSGGVHSVSPNRCAVIGAVISVSLGITSVFISKNISLTMIAFLILIGLIYSYCYICKYAPADSPQKPITNILKKNHLKNASIMTATIMYIIVGILILFYKYSHNIVLLRYALCITFGVVWQTFSLTDFGHNVLHRIDSLFIKTQKEE